MIAHRLLLLLLLLLRFFGRFGSSSNISSSSSSSSSLRLSLFLTPPTHSLDHAAKHHRPCHISSSSSSSSSRGQKGSMCSLEAFDFVAAMGS